MSRVWIAALVLSFGCAEHEHEVDSTEQHVRADEQPGMPPLSFEEDPSDPGSEPLGPETRGEGDLPPEDPSIVGRQQAYLLRWRAEHVGWVAAGMTDEEMEARRSALKEAIVGGAP